MRVLAYAVALVYHRLDAMSTPLLAMLNYGAGDKPIDFRCIFVV